MDIVKPVRIERAIIAFAIVTMVVVGLVVAAASILPLQSQMASAADNAFEFELDLQVGAIGESLARIRDLGNQVTSRSAIRDMLASYNRRQVSLEQLRAFTADKLLDSLKLSREMLGITRLGPDFGVLVQVGRAVPPELWQPGEGAPPALGKPCLIDGTWLVLVAAPILNRDGGREGLDLLLFDAGIIRSRVGDTHNLGLTGELVLGRMTASGPEVFFPRRDGGTGVDSQIREAFATAEEPAGLRRMPRDDGVLDMVLVRRLPGSDWIVMARQAVSELHYRVDRLVLRVVVGAAALIGFGIVGFLVLLRPLAGRALVTIGDLQRQEVARQQAQHALERALEGTIEAVASTIEIRDPYTAGHQRRVADIAVAIGRELGLDENRIKGLQVAGTIHDIGKIAVPAEILARPGRIGPLEMDIIRLHAADGCNILSGVEFPWPVADMVRHHHERMDGTGYPDGLKGDEIILEARILAVADVVEAIASDRPYRAALGLGAALGEIEAHRGTRFDAAVVDACRKLADEGRLPLPGVDRGDLPPPLARVN